MEIDALKTLVLVAQQGSFAAVARGLNVDPSSVSRQIAGLEAALGLRLFQRSTRALKLTEEGALYLARIQPLLDELDHARDDASRIRHAPTGTLRITASVAFAHECIVPHLGEFQSRYPDLTVELVPSDRVIDITAEGLDLAIRLGPHPTGDLVSTRLIPTRYRVCAAPDYIETHGTVATPHDLQNRACLRFALPDYRTRWRFRQPDSPVFEVPVSGHLVIANALSLRRCAHDGLGPALLADWLIGADLATGRLIDLFPAYECTATDFDTAAWALYPSRSYLPRKTRVMLDFLRQKLRQPPL